MQTFVPYRSIARSLAVLDGKRLGKQRLEAYDVLGMLTQFHATLDHTSKQAHYLRSKYGRADGSWHHPAILMWQGYEGALWQYGWQCCVEFNSRGCNGQVMRKRFMRARTVLEVSGLHVPVWPPWLGDERVHASHRSNLLRKERSYYEKFGWEEPDDMPYYWPGATAPRLVLIQPRRVT